MWEVKKSGERGIRCRRICDCMVLGLLTIAVCVILCGGDRVFGSRVDWISQHSVIADYFRRQFYETGKLFPEFAPNIGGGQNIYHFSYYGLYSPVILFSYFLPFVKMGDYLMGASIVGLGAAVILFYCWMASRRFSRAVSFFVSAMFLLAGPMMFHSYSQVMFVNYMPFLCMGFWGIDRYFEKGKRLLFPVSVFLMIMTSFYFSICGMLVLVLYGLHRFFQTEYVRGNKVRLASFFKAGFGFGMHVAGAVMMSGILLIPTALALTGRGGEKGSFGFWELIIPKVQVMRFMYHPYGIGLTSLVLTVLIAGLGYRRFYDRVLVYGTVFILVLPVFAWMLNGGLYVRDKAMIPFLPLLCYMTADYLEKLRKREGGLLRGLVPYLVTLGVLFLGRTEVKDFRVWLLIMADGALMAVFFVNFYRKRNILVLIVPPVIFLLGFTCVFNKCADRMLESEDYNRVTDERIGKAVSSVVEKEEGFYRTEQMGSVSDNGKNVNRIWDMGQYVSSVYSSAYNEDYQDFRQQVFGTEEPFRNFLMQPSSENPLFQRFMGVKYLVAYEEASGKDGSEIPGYELYESLDGIEVYRNEAVSPIAYGTNQVISEEEYSRLKFPYNQLALMEYAVVKEEADENRRVQEFQGEKPETEVRINDLWEVDAADMKVPQWEEEGSFMEETDDGYHIQSEKKKKVQVPIGGQAAEEIWSDEDKMPVMLIRFQVRNHKPSKDVSIWVGKEKNTLSAKSHIYYNHNTVFTYAVAFSEGMESVNMVFGKGDYDISDIKCYLCCEKKGDMREKNSTLYQSEFYPDKDMTGGNRIAGEIDVKKDGYFITTIPYDKGFEVKVDGRTVECEKVNTAFLGFRIEKGSHQVEIVYHAPGMMAGMILSVMGVVILCLGRYYKGRWGSYE